MINAEKLTFGFDSTLLFQNISFTLEENCHCALIGSNGTGKTTLTNLIRETTICGGRALWSRWQPNSATAPPSPAPDSASGVPNLSPSRDMIPCKSFVLITATMWS